MSASKFDLSVYKVVSRIPKGRVATYAAVAGALGCRAPQAVGQALRRNPFAPEVPCHRVIGSGLTLVGFQGHRQGEAIAAKRALLTREGVAFDEAGRLLDRSRVMDASELEEQAAEAAITRCGPPL